MKSIKGVMGILILGVFFFSSCNKNKLCVKGEGDLVTQTLRLHSFSEIDLQEAVNVHIHQGSEQLVTVTGNSNIIALLETDVSGSRWEIGFNRSCVEEYQLTIDITIVSLSKVVLSGAGDMDIDEFSGNENLDISISGSGDVQLDAFADLKYFKALISGSGNITARQSVDGILYTDVTISGSGHVHVFKWMTENSELLISGSGDIQTTTNTHMDVRISGSGDVHYQGYPAIHTDVSGSGDLVNRN